MWIETASYMVTFVISTGCAAIGILLSYQLYQVHQKPVFQLLLFQQIFLMSFFIYGIWGNMAIKEIISDLNVDPVIITKLSVLVPVIGLPFLLVSWFMLIRFSFVLNGYSIPRKFAIMFFVLMLSFVFAFFVLIQQELFIISGDPDIFIVRVLVLLNLLVHLIFATAFFFPKKYSPVRKETGFKKEWFYIFIAGTLIYSGALYYFNRFGYISICISTILLFSASIIIPVLLKINGKFVPSDIQTPIDSFETFCSQFEISKREAEIVIEICSGKTNKAIAEKLFITLQTVKDHNHRIFTKTGVKSRVQLANMVRERTGQK